jgi:hypothetical protein
MQYDPGSVELVDSTMLDVFDADGSESESEYEYEYDGTETEVRQRDAVSP